MPAPELYTLEIDKKQLAEVEAAIGDYAETDKVLARALNDTGRRIRSRMTKVAAKELGLKQKKVKQRVWASKANRRKLHVVILGGKWGWPVYEEGGAVQTETGVKVGRGRKAQTYPHAFIATMRSGHTGIFVRKGRRRLPVREVRTDSVTSVVRALGKEREIIDDAQAFLVKRVHAQMQRVIDKRGAA